MQLLRRQSAIITIYGPQDGIKKLIGKRPFILENTENENAIRWTENGLKVKERTGKKEGNKPKNAYTIENTVSIPERLASVLSQLTRESFFVLPKTMSFHSEMRPSSRRGWFTRIQCKEIISRVKNQIEYAKTKHGLLS